MASMRLWLALTLAVVVVACSGGVDEPTGGSAAGTGELAPVSQPDGPLRGLVLTTADIAEDGSSTPPRLAFTTGDTQVTALVGLGGEVPEGSGLTVSWYRRTGFDGRELLFAQDITIGPGGSAFSEGLAPGGLAPGVYETVATLAEREVATPWVVRIAEPEAGGAAASGEISAAAASTGDEDWNVPEPGDSGWNEPQPEASPPPPGPCRILGVHPDFEPFLDAEAKVLWDGTCSTMSLAATVAGSPQTLATRTDIDPAGAHLLNAAAEVCSLPGGSDLPGTVVAWTATGSDGQTSEATFSLPDFGPTLQALVQSVPEENTRVDPGQRIQLRGMAVVVPPALGIEKLSLRAGDQLIKEVGNLSGTASPEPCDYGRFGAINHTSYVVPEDPPAVILICADALGFDGTEATGCIEFFTGEVWEGQVTGETVQPRCSPPSVPVSGELRLVVASDGTVSGTVTERRDGYTCAGTPVPPFEGNYTITGTKTATAFELTVSGTGTRDVTLSIDGSTATASFEEINGGYGASITYTAECRTCDG